jgi:hypothetical protein
MSCVSDWMWSKNLIFRSPKFYRMPVLERYVSKITSSVLLLCNCPTGSFTWLTIFEKYLKTKDLFNIWVWMWRSEQIWVSQKKEFLWFTLMMGLRKLFLTLISKNKLHESVEITNKMQPYNRIYYSKVFWFLDMFRAAHRPSSGALNCICSLWFIYTCGDQPLSRLSGISHSALTPAVHHVYTRCFTTYGHYCRRWFPRYL